MSDQDYYAKQDAERKRTGGPAYPTGPDVGGGMALLDYFAGQALAGLLAYSPDGSAAGDQMGYRSAAAEAYAHAAAMVEERARRRREAK